MTKIWLGETGATETQIAALEQRIGQSLPPSYRSFLMVLNGFQSPENSIPELYGTEAVDWFRVRHPE
jgi:cell wall assembly regulator SMI1